MLEYLFDSEWRQRSDIEKLKRRNRITVRSAARERGRGRRRVEKLEEEVAELTLVTSALLAHLRAQAGWDEAAFRERFQTLDLEDGELDGKLRKENRGEQQSRPKPVVRRRRP